MQGEDELAAIERELSAKAESLRDHQRDGVRFVLQCFQHAHGCILADEMGLGKTCQVTVY